MGEGLFILLCILALTIGTRARNSKIQSPKSLTKKKKIKHLLAYIALVLIGLLLIFFVPALYTELKIAFDTHFSIESILSIVVVLIGSFTFVSLLTKLRKEI